MFSLVSFLPRAIVQGIPLLLGCVGETLNEKSGSLNLGIPGVMYVGGICGVIGAFMYENSGGTYNPVLGVVIPIITCMLGALIMGLIFCFLTVTLRANQNVTGLTITTFGVAFYYFIGNALSNSQDGWPKFSGTALERQSQAIHIPGLSDIPFVGKALFSHNILVYAGIVIAILMWLYFKKTVPGLKLRAIGENPGAADSLGVNVAMYKYIHIIVMGHRTLFEDSVAYCLIINNMIRANESGEIESL